MLLIMHFSVYFTNLLYYTKNGPEVTFYKGYSIGKDIGFSLNKEKKFSTASEAMGYEDGEDIEIRLENKRNLQKMATQP